MERLKAATGDESAPDHELTILRLGDAIFRPTMHAHAPTGLASIMASLSRMREVVVVLVD